MDDISRRLALLLSRVDSQSRPNINALSEATRDLNVLALNVKFFGYELARQLAQALPVRTGLGPRPVGLRSKPSTQADLESEWVAYWCSELKIPLVFHRKLWELAYVLQAIYEHGHLRTGSRGLGFGCGSEPLPSYLAAHGVIVTATDLPPHDSRTQGWIDTSQHTTSVDRAFNSDLVTREQFDRCVGLRYVDMNAIPRDLAEYDFCWSICALEHIGSIQKGLDFIADSLSTLRPGGLAVHTTEFNFMNDRETIDNWGTVLFQRRHFSAIAERLRDAGHRVAELEFDVGDKPLDKFIDVAPFAHDWDPQLRASWGDGGPHIKLSVDGFACTCFGLVITKSESNRTPADTISKSD
jgi:2-polyprenyl-3-methyl-5-hydroxy-6-metoxy-1,4-benzoquinol methylase